MQNSDTRENATGQVRRHKFIFNPEKDIHGTHLILYIFFHAYPVSTGSSGFAGFLCPFIKILVGDRPAHRTGIRVLRATGHPPDEECKPFYQISDAKTLTDTIL